MLPGAILPSGFFVDSALALARYREDAFALRVKELRAEEGHRRRQEELRVELARRCEQEVEQRRQQVVMAKERQLGQGPGPEAPGHRCIKF